MKKIIKNQLRKEQKKLIDYKWLVKIIFMAFIISVTFSILSEKIIPSVNITAGIIILVVFILIGIIFDMIGVAVSASDIVPFNSMGSRKVKGANVAVDLIKNADKVSSFCCDVIGDICGIISGTTGAIIALKLSIITSIDPLVMILLVTGIMASITIGGKAIGKSFAINKSNYIIYEVAKLIKNLEMKI